MPPRQRVASKPKAKEDTKQDAKQDAKQDSDNGGPREAPEEQAQQGRRRRGGPSWKPVFKTIGFFFLIILIPGLLNYASLKQEARMLVPTGK